MLLLKFSTILLLLAICDALPDTAFRLVNGEENDNAKSHASLLRLSHPAYPNKKDEMVIGPNPRNISNIVVKADSSKTNKMKRTDLLWAWGQFVDHDMSLTEGNDTHTEASLIKSPDEADMVQMIPFSRSVHKQDSQGVRQQINEITAFIDASMIYGSDKERSDALRSFKYGRMKMQRGNKLLPLNKKGLPNAMPPNSESKDFFLAGDIRANEQLGLMALHTLFVREHNRLVKKLKSAYPSATDEELYQWGRKLVGAEIQKITYDEFLPMLIGEKYACKSADYKYDSNVNPGIANEFSTVAFRVGHTMLSPELLLARKAGKKWKKVGTTGLVGVFFDTALLMKERLDIDEVIGGFCVQEAQEVDTELIEAVRSFLFAPNGGVGQDLASLNIQRGRDHGIPKYTELRLALKLKEVKKFDDITSDGSLQLKMSEAYDNDVRNVDAWIGGLAEDHMPGSMVGELFAYIIKDQFTRLMNGDKFFFSGDKSLQDSGIKQILDIDQVTLAKVIAENTIINNGLDGNVFQAS